MGLFDRPSESISAADVARLERDVKSALVELRDAIEAKSPDTQQNAQNFLAEYEEHSLRRARAGGARSAPAGAADAVAGPRSERGPAMIEEMLPRIDEGIARRCGAQRTGRYRRCTSCR